LEGCDGDAGGEEICVDFEKLVSFANSRGVRSTRDEDIL